MNTTPTAAPTAAPTKFYGTIEMVTSTRALIALADSCGALLCAMRLDGRDLHARGYAFLSHAAEVKGGRLERYSREVAS